MIRDILPNNTEYIEDSTILYNSNHPDGVKLNENTITTTGINIGSHNPWGNSYIRFSVRIVDKTLEKGPNQLVNWANVTIHDTQEPSVNKDDVSIMINKQN